jgi:methanogenesis marker radical SAM protein
MLINVYAGGTPGKDCGGFCRFCYFYSMDYENLDSISTGCEYCPPNQVGCQHCRVFINDIKNGFKPVSEIISHLNYLLRWYEFMGILNYDDLRVLTVSCADMVSYPQLPELVRKLKELQLKVYLGYTSGKRIKNESMATELATMGIDHLNFSVFSTKPELRRKWMGDQTPEESLKACKLFCETMEVHASTVVIPGVIDQEEIFSTCNDLEDWGVKTFLLSRFVNHKYEGLILNKGPIIEGIESQPYEEFLELVKTVSKEYPFKVAGTPFTDSETKGNPYLLSKKRNREYLNRLPPVTSEATIITSKLSYKPLNEIFNIIAGDKVNVIGLSKEIGDLITHEDLYEVDLDEVKNKIIIPGGALVHDKVALNIFNRDGVVRSVVRGPNALFFYELEDNDYVDLLQYELKSFNTLIKKINFNSGIH